MSNRQNAGPNAHRITRCISERSSAIFQMRYLSMSFGMVAMLPCHWQSRHLSDRFLGTSKVIAGGAITVGAWVTTDSSGEAVATTTDGDIVIGRALEAADDGDIFEVQLGIQHLYIA